MDAPGKKILVVDDSATIRSFMVAVLGRHYTCDQAADGAEAIAKAQQDPPDAMLLDLEMPHLNGIDVLRALKGDSSTRHIPIVIVTQNTSVEQMNLCHSLGCAGFVLKPVQPDYLKVKLGRLLAAPR